MSASTIGIRASRNGRMIFVESGDTTVVAGDLVMVDSGGSRFLAMVALTADQILANPISIARGQVIAGAGSTVVDDAVRLRDAAALELARGEIGADLTILSATWSDDLGRLTLQLSPTDTNPEKAVERIEARFRAEVRCVW